MRRRLPLQRLPEDWREPRGLRSAEAAERLERYGPNHIVEAQAHRAWDLARDTARDPMIWFLIVTGVVYGGLGEWRESLVLLVSIIPLVGMDAYLHRRTAASTAGLAQRLAERARVERDGHVIDVPAAAVVPGDVATVSSGEWFPADGALVEGEGLQVDESILSGESYPARKQVCPALPRVGGEPSVEAEHWVFAGTRLLTGEARVRVAFTGGETLYGEIVRSAMAGTHARTPLQVAIARLVSTLVVGASAFCLLLAGVRWWQGHGLVDATLSALTLGVAAFPEEFPVVFAFFLGFGVYRLALRQALVRQAVSVENIGRVSTILSDKTGTITEGRLRLTHVVATAEVGRERVLQLAATASRRDSGDPLDDSIFAEAPSVEHVERLATFPFTEARRRETTIAREEDGTLIGVTKGAVELILSMCSAEAAERKHWETEAARLAAEGHKVIACAWQSLGSAARRDEPDGDYRLAGLLAFEDPVRDGVREAVQSCRDAGIRVILVTGDHAATAAAVAREIGLSDEPNVISGDEMARLVAEGGAGSLRSIDVVARALPAQKLELVRALQAVGESVAVTGDGVNDVPALQAADVGIAMGESGTRSAREVAAIVLLDDNLRTIVSAILEGRQLFRNLQSSFQYLMMVHLPLVASAAVVPLLGYPILYLPIHVVWFELVIHPTALLAFQGIVEPKLLGRRPARRGSTFFSISEWRSVATVGAFVTAVVMATYVLGIELAGRTDRSARSLSVLCLILSSVGISATATGLQTRASRWVCGIVTLTSVVMVQSPGASELLQMAPLELVDWLVAFAAMAGSALLCAALFHGESNEGGSNSRSDRFLAFLTRSV